MSTPRPALAEPPTIIAVPASDYVRAREALPDAIGNQGLVLGPVSRFGEMLERIVAEAPANARR